MRTINFFAFAALFVLGFVELCFPRGAALVFYAYDPQFRRVLDVTKLTDQQRQLCQQFHSAMNTRCQLVFYFGIATIVFAMLLLVADRQKKKRFLTHNSGGAVLILKIK